MQKRSSTNTRAKKSRAKLADENQIAKSIVDLIAEISNEEPPKEKDPLAVELGQRGGLKGGKARAEKLSAKKRTEIAKKAAKARWDKDAA